MPPQAETSGLMHIAEIVHWVALGVMGLVYTIRLFWLLSFKAGRDRQKPGERFGNTGMSPALYSLMNVAMPWGMESTRKGLPFYLSFVVFHLGVTSGIFFAVVGSAYPPIMEITVLAYALMFMIGAAFLVAIGRIIRRVVRPVMRLISTPDDYFSLMTLTVWFGLGVPAIAHTIGLLAGEGFLVAYLFATAFFLVYVPFSKISHYLYYPFTRYWIGKTLGHRGSMPPASARS